MRKGKKEMCQSLCHSILSLLHLRPLFDLLRIRLKRLCSIFWPCFWSCLWVSLFIDGEYSKKDFCWAACFCTYDLASSAPLEPSIDYVAYRMHVVTWYFEHFCCQCFGYVMIKFFFGLNVPFFTNEWSLPLLYIRNTSFICVV